MKIEVPAKQSQNNNNNNNDDEDNNAIIVSDAPNSNAPRVASTQADPLFFRGLGSSTQISRLHNDHFEPEPVYTGLSNLRNNSRRALLSAELSEKEEERRRYMSTLTKEQVLRILQLYQKQFEDFNAALKKKTGCTIMRMEGDGNCLFRAFSQQVYGEQDMHDEIRRQCVDYMAKERDHFSQFVTEDFSKYLDRKRRNGVYGNHLEIQALGELFNRPVEIYTYENGVELQKINIFQDDFKTSNAPIRLSYHHGNHYNAVIDPQNPTVGVGLGLPDFVPMNIENSLMQKTMEQTETQVLEQRILDHTKKQTELEETEDEIFQRVLLESKNSGPQNSSVSPTLPFLPNEDDDDDQLLQQAILESQKEK